MRRPCGLRVHMRPPQKTRDALPKQPRAHPCMHFSTAEATGLQRQAPAAASIRPRWPCVVTPSAREASFSRPMHLHARNQQSGATTTDCSSCSGCGLSDHCSPKRNLRCCLPILVAMAAHDAHNDDDIYTPGLTGTAGCSRRSPTLRAWSTGELLCAGPGCSNDRKWVEHSRASRWYHA